MRSTWQSLASKKSFKVCDFRFRSINLTFFHARPSVWIFHFKCRKRKFLSKEKKNSPSVQNFFSFFPPTCYDFLYYPQYSSTCWLCRFIPCFISAQRERCSGTLVCWKMEEKQLLLCWMLIKNKKQDTKKSCTKQTKK